MKNFGAPHRHDLAPGPAKGPGALTVRPLAGRAGLRLEGEADLTGQPQLREALAALPPAAEIPISSTSPLPANSSPLPSSFPTPASSCTTRPRPSSA